MKLLRKKQGITLERLAEQTGMTKSYLSKVERGLSSPSIATALKLSNVLNVGVEALFSVSPAAAKDYHLERADKRPQSEGNGESGYAMLTRQVQERTLLAFLLYPAAVFSDKNFKEHTGEEFLFLHKGSVEVDFTDEQIIMHCGDSISFPGHKPHRIRSIGTELAEMLVVVRSGEGPVLPDDPE